MYYYSLVKKKSEMTQDELTDLYKESGVIKTDLNDLINEAEELISKLTLEKLIVTAPERENIEEKIDNLRKQLTKLKKSKCYRLAKGEDSIVRVYPNEELINRIVEAHLYLAYNYAKKHSKKDDCDSRKYSFDDLFQMGAEALIHAAKQYVPGGTATFVTYARRCIENRLNRELHKEKKKTKIKRDFFTFEFERINLARKMLLKLTNNNFSFSNRLRLFCNRIIKEFNKKMYYCQGETMPLIKEGTVEFDFTNVYNRLISNSLINELVLEEDKWVIRCAMENSGNHHSAVNFEACRLELYLYKLAAIKELMEFEKQYMRENDGLAPSEEELYDHLVRQSHRVKRASSENSTQMSLSNFSEAYYDEYGAWSLDSNSLEEEKEDIIDDFIQKTEAISLDNLSPTDEEFINKYFKDGVWDEELYYQEQLKIRHQSVSNRVKQANSQQVPINRMLLELANYHNYYGSKINWDDFRSIRNAEIRLCSLELWRDNSEDLLKQPRRTLEEEALENIGIGMYKNALQELSEPDKQVLKLWLSSDGIRQHTDQEIAAELGISLQRVRGAKSRAKRALRKNEGLHDYLSEPL